MTAKSSLEPTLWMNDKSTVSLSLSLSLSTCLPSLTSNTGRQYLGAGKNSVAEIGDVEVVMIGAEQMEREEMVNTNKAEGGGLDGSNSTFFVTLLAVVFQ